MANSTAHLNRLVFAAAVILSSSCAPVRLGFGGRWAACTGRPENDAPLLSLAIGLSERVVSTAILKSLQLTRAEERELLNLNAGRGVLLPYKNVNRQSNELVIFVHGLHELTDVELSESREALSAGNAELVTRKPSLRNLIAALIGSEAFSAFQATRSETCASACMRHHLRVAVPTFTGNHVSVLHDPALIAALQP